MNYKATLYTAIVRLLYYLAYPVLKLTGSVGNFESTLIYFIARCSGYTKQNALMLVKQARLESGGYTSRARREANNIFGMKMPRKRATTAIGTITLNEGEFARYRSIADSVLDRILLDEYFKTRKTQNWEDYIEEVLLNGYATDEKYKEKWIATPAHMDFNAGYITAGIYTALAIIFILYKRHR